MKFTIKIWNYRSITRHSPIELEFQEGITFVLGVNNVGKTNLLRFIYDFRSAFLIQKGKYHNSFNVGIGSSQYDHIINRQNPDGGIRFDLVAENLKVNFTVSPNGSNPHTHSVIVSYAIENDSIKDGNDWDMLINCLNILQRSIYIGPGRVVMNQTSARYYDVEIGGRFYANWGDWSAGGDLSKMEKIQSLKTELQGLFGFTHFDIILESNKNKLFIKTDDGLFDLNDLGGGISQFIFVLANALIKEPSYVLIDEPEAGLHPMLQQSFVQALAAKAKVGLIATSHSIGLARSTGDKILSLTKDDKGASKLAPFGKHFAATIHQSITELGYSQYAEVGGNIILLVEGRTDIKAFREILRLYKIDSKVIIMSLGGRQFIVKQKEKIMDELSEIRRLNAKVAVVFDSESEEEGASLKEEFRVFNKCCLDLGYITCPTDYHSTENYITQKAVDLVIGKPIKALTPYEKFNNQWSKEKNWLMFREMSKIDFDTTNLGKFIEDTLVPLCNRPTNQI